MSFSQISGWGFGAGLLGLALLLFVLQWLRVRHRQVEVVTTLFWREAIEESRARVLWQRFRHPWAYLGILSIAALMWLAWAGPEFSREDETEAVFLLDGSAAMGVGERFDEAKGRLQKAVEAWPLGQRRVYWSGGDLRLLLDRDEEAGLLAARLEGSAVEASPGQLERDCLALAARSGDRSTELILVGEAPVGEAVQARLPDSVSLRRLVGPSMSEDEGINRGVHALGMAPSEVDYEAVEVYFRTGTSREGFEVTLDGLPYEGEVEPLAPGEWMLRGVPARGGRLAVAVSGSDALVADDRAELQLPLRQRLRLQLGSGLPEVVAAWLRSDRALQLVDSDPQVVVGQANDPALARVPSLSWVGLEQQTEAFVVTATEGEASLEGLFSELGLDQIDATALAQQSGEVIRLTVEPGETKSVRIWESLMTPDYNWTKSTAFPLFIARTVRWLAGEALVDPFVRVGESHEALRAGGAPYAPPRAGEYSGVDGEVLVAALGEDVWGARDGVERVMSVDGGAGGVNWVTWIILLVLALLLWEWVSYRKGRLP